MEDTPSAEGKSSLGMPSASETAGSEHGQKAYDWWKRIGSPKNVCAPMVWNSEGAFRRLVRKYGCELTYTPMIKAKEFLLLKTEAERRARVEPCPLDRPLIVQFASDDPEEFLQAATLVQDWCDAVDLNMGCPQAAAARDHYGAVLMEEPELCRRIVTHAASGGLKIPVSCKIRIFEDTKRTVEFARMLEQSGCSLLTVHGRTRCKTHHEGMCDWSAIRAVKEAVQIPVLANGGMIRTLEHVRSCLEETGADGVMSAIGLLLNPRMFAGDKAPSADRITLLLEYLDVAEQFDTTPARCLRDHMMVMLREIMCPSYYRRGSDTDEHRDLWNMTCSAKLTHVWQCKQVVYTLAYREGHPLAPAQPPSSLKSIKRGWLCADDDDNEDDEPVEEVYDIFQ